MASNNPPRQKIVLAVDWFTPAFRAGGPIRSTSNLVELLVESYDVWVVCGAFDLGMEEPLDIPVNAWQTLQCEKGSAKIMYWTRDRWNSQQWLRIFQEIHPDWLHLNSVFSKAFTLTPLRVARKFPMMKVVLAPRGMLGAAALSIKPLKKRMFLSYARAVNLFRDVRWHASTELERKEILGQLIGTDIRVAQNLSTRPPMEVAGRSSGRWNVAVVGRIHRVKNLEFGLSALLKASSSRPISLTFIGPIEDENYRSELELLGGAQTEIEVHFAGGVEPTKLGVYLDAAHYLLSPTTQENFGHSIVEAWAHGCPVLISDRTPWLDLGAKGIGWDWPLEKSTWEKGLKEAFNLSHEEWELKSKAARKYFNEHVRNDDAEEANLKLFSS